MTGSKDFHHSVWTSPYSPFDSGSASQQTLSRDPVRRTILAVSLDRSSSNAAMKMQLFCAMMPFIQNWFEFHRCVE
jgi:hypothetical protein